MASNENPFGPSPMALEAIRAAAAEVHLYPDNDAASCGWALEGPPINWRGTDFYC